jgi:hypothetical protein
VGCGFGLTSTAMPYRRKDAEYLREKARTFCRLTQDLATPAAEQLLAVANDMEAKADEIERRPDPRHLSP